MSKNSFSKYGVAFFDKVPHQENPNQFSARPAVILNILKNGDFEICPITKKVNQAKNYRHILWVNPKTEEAKYTKLRMLPSMLILDRIGIVPRSFAVNQFGVCNKALIDKIEEIRQKNNL